MISIITTCVNFCDLLKLTYKRNSRQFSKFDFFVITSPQDKQTQDFCFTNNIFCHQTDEFYKNGAEFNKAEAINKTVIDLKDEVLANDWILLCDADVVVDKAIETFVSLEEKREDCLYSTGRIICETERDLIEKDFIEEDCFFFGFFQMFHKSKIENKIRNGEGFLKSSNDASSYDLKFRDSFDVKGRLENCHAFHLGPMRVNWKGRVSQTWHS